MAETTLALCGCFFAHANASWREIPPSSARSPYASKNGRKFVSFAARVDGAGRRVFTPWCSSSQSAAYARAVSVPSCTRADRASSRAFSRSSSCAPPGPRNFARLPT